MDLDGEEEPQEPQSSLDWLFNTPVIVPLLILVPPVGVFLVWKTEWTKRRRIALTVLGSICTLGIIATFTIPPIIFVMHFDSRTDQLEQVLGMEFSGVEGEPAESAGLFEPSLSNACVKNLAPPLGTLRFLNRIESLMEDYEPKPSSERYQCITGAQIAARTKSRKKRARAMRRKGEDATRRTLFEFEHFGYVLAHTFATDLSNYKSPTQFACYFHNKGRREFFGWDFGLCVPDPKSKSWPDKLQTYWEPGEFKAAYSKEEPELMQRMRGANIVAPKDVACLVTDVQPSGMIECQGDGPIRYNLRTGHPIGPKSSAVNINRGDIVVGHNLRELRQAGPKKPWVFGGFEVKDIEVIEQSKCCTAPASNRKRS